MSQSPVDRAYVGRTPNGFGVDVRLVHHHGNERYAIGLPTAVTFKDVDDSTAYAVDDGPTFQMPEDMARALLEALAAHFGGTSEVQTLRKDYLAERARVDRLIEHLAAKS